MDMRANKTPVIRPVVEWLDYRAHYMWEPGHHVNGTILIAPDFYSPQLDNRRDILIYLPPSYQRADRQYPVIYMHDGQNLFDNDTSYAGEWGVDETMEMLAHTEGLEAIIVGVANAGVHRIAEYSPFVDRRMGGGRGDAYLRFLVETLKPRIDRDFRTLPDRRHTGVIGSSLGGLISLYAFFKYPAVYGFAGVMSPALWFGGDAIYRYVQSADYVPGKLYLDTGTREMGEDANSGRLHRAAASRRYYASVRRMKGILIRKGYRPMRDLLHVEEKWALHNEAFWARRLPPALRFLLSEALRQTRG